MEGSARENAGGDEEPCPRDLARRLDSKDEVPASACGKRESKVNEARWMYYVSLM